MIAWLLSLVPWWLWAILALAIIGGVQWAFGWKAAIGALITALPVLGVLWGRKLGSDAAEAKRDREALDHVIIRKQVDDDVANMGAQDLDAEYQRWNRND